MDGITRLGGSLVLRGNGDIAQSSKSTVNVGASLVLDNSLATTGIDRIGNLAQITLAGGQLVHIGHADAGHQRDDRQADHPTSHRAATGGGSSVVRSVHNGGNLTLNFADFGLDWTGRGRRGAFRGRGSGSRLRQPTRSILRRRHSDADLSTAP